MKPLAATTALRQHRLAAAAAPGKRAAAVDITVASCHIHIDKICDQLLTSLTDRQ